MVNGKDKGNFFELKMLRRIRAELDPDAYSPRGSGNSKDDKGDICTREYCFEMKHHRVIRPLMISRWWDKLVAEADQMSKVPVLVYKENFRPEMVCVEDCGVKVFYYLDDWLKITGAERTKHD